MALPASAERPAPQQTLVRVSVLGGSGRMDLSLPGAVPVVSMVANLTRLLDMETAQSHLVVTTTGVVLDPNLGLLDQEIGDGAMLTLAPVREHVPPELHDDVVEAVHSLSRSEWTAWGQASAAVTSYAASAWLLCLGAAALAVVGVLHPQEAMVTGVVAGAGALGLLLVVAFRTPIGTPHAVEWRSVVPVWFACMYAALSGALVAASQRLGPEPLAVTEPSAFGPMVWAAASALCAAGVACVVLRRNRLLVAPVIFLGAAVVAGTLAESSGFMAAEHCMTLVATVWVLAARAAPGLALEATALRGTTPSRRDTVGAAAGVDTERLRTDLAVSHDLVLAVALSSIGLLLVAVPTALTSGVTGLLWIGTLIGIIALRLRRVRLHADVALGLGGVGLVTTLVVGWSPTLPSALVVVLAGVLLAAGIVVQLTGGRVASLRAGWLGDRTEVLLTAACVPLCLAVVWPTLLPGG